MNKFIILSVSLLISTSVFAQRQACVVNIDRASDVEKLSCSEGDYVTFWSSSADGGGLVKVSAAMMHACDLSKPFQLASANANSAVNTATCTLKRIRIPVIHDDKQSRQLIE